MWSKHLWCFTVLLVTQLWENATGEVLNSYILDYEPLDLSHSALNNLHHRIKRSLDNELRWDFWAYDRHFQLRLRPAEDIFAPEHTVEFDSGPPQKADTSFIYNGYVKDEPQSHVHIAILPDIVVGHIMLPGETYHIEPARDHPNLKGADFHTIIYPQTKMNLDPFKHLRKGSFCGHNATEPPSEAKDAPYGPQPQPGDDHAGESFSARYRRETTGTNLLHPDHTRCWVGIKADNTLYAYTLSKQTGATAKLRAQKTRSELYAVFARHVDFLTKTYENVKFHAKGDTSRYYLGINFQIYKTTVITECNVPPANWETGYCVNNMDVGSFLKFTALRAEQDWFCISFTFVYRDFHDGVVGLAYIPQPGTRDGMCGKYQPARYNNKIVSMILNTGLVSFINFGVNMPPITTHITFAHEVGHLFGSIHDKAKTTCAPLGTNLPGAAEGNFIMFPDTPAGNLPHNTLFSECTKEYIFKVLDSKLDDGKIKTHCFVPRTATFCGNTIKEKGEECDCGYAADCDTVDQCCVPASNADPNIGCTHKSNAFCSPTSGPCCNQTCGLMPDTVQCGEASECKAASFCPGNSSVCPEPITVKDFSAFCESYTGTCFSGQCTGSLCQKIGWQDCYADDSNSNDHTCILHCKNGTNGVCISTTEASLTDLLFGDKKSVAMPNPALGIRQPAGAMCNHFTGYCDSRGKCRPYDINGIYKRLMGGIFVSETWFDVEAWIEKHWYIVLVLCVVCVILLGLAIRCCSYSTPPYDPARGPPPEYYDDIDQPKKNKNANVGVVGDRGQKGHRRRPDNAARQESRNASRDDKLRQGPGAKGGKPSKEDKNAKGGRPSKEDKYKDLEKGDRRKDLDRKAPKKGAAARHDNFDDDDGGLWSRGSKRYDDLRNEQQQKQRPKKSRENPGASELPGRAQNGRAPSRRQQNDFVNHGYQPFGDPPPYHDPVAPSFSQPFHPNPRQAGQHSSMYTAPDPDYGGHDMNPYAQFDQYYQAPSNSNRQPPYQHQASYSNHFF